MNMQLLQDDYQFKIVVIDIFLVNFGAHMNILFVVGVRILVDIEWSYSNPPTHTHKSKVIVL